MEGKTLRIPVTDEVYEQMQALCKRDGIASPTAFVRELMNTAFGKGANGTSPSTPDGEGKAPTAFPKRKGGLSLGSPTPTKRMREYVRRGGLCYPVHQSKGGSRFPLVDMDRVVCNEFEDFVEPELNWCDVTDELSTFENDWLDCWIKDFDKMNGIYEERIKKRMISSFIRIDDYEWAIAEFKKRDS